MKNVWNALGPDALEGIPSQPDVRVIKGLKIQVQTPLLELLSPVEVCDGPGYQNNKQSFAG